ncbi:MAG: hypothetical protein AAF230_11165 [Pseudomonadota bacterium]
MKKLMVLALLALPGCEDPTLGIGATISGSGVSVSPVVSGRVGDVGVAVSP